MDENQFNIQKLKEIFADAEGERTIEVTEDEYQALLTEALVAKMDVKKEADHFLIQFPELTVKIVCELEDEDI
jgi:hypothetical protein